MTTYSTGTVTIGAGSTSLTGTGTAWLTSGVRAGDELVLAGLSARIASVGSNTSITLAQGWPGAAQTGQNYYIRLNDDGVRALAAANLLFQALGAGTLTSLGNIAGAANLMPYWTGAGVMNTTALTSAARSLLDDADVAAMRATLGLGTAAVATLTTSTTDATAGRVARIGDAGLGGAAAIALTDGDNLDTIAANGFYCWATSVPAGAPGGTFGQLLHVQRASTSRSQIAMRSAGDQTLYIRGYTGGVYQPWNQIWHSGTLLGTVSQSGGLPTGRVIERGSNANGEYVRFADGTQICTRTVSASLAISTGFLGGFRTAAQGWTYPAVFAAAPALTVTPLNLTAFGGIGANTPTTTAAQWAVTAVTTQTAATRDVTLTAVGRWF